MRATTALPRLSRYAALTVLAAVFAFPFYWMFVTSVEPASHLSDIPPNLLPLWDWRNYAAAWSAAPWGRYLLNSLFVSGAATALALLTALPAAYAFALLRFPGKRLLFIAILIVLVIPDNVILIPQYQVLGALNWLNTYRAQIVPFGANAFAIFLLRQFFLGLPPELWDAAQLDGCARTTYLVRIAAPLARAAMAAIAVYVFVGQWNQLLYPLVVAGLNPDVQPVQVGLATFLGVHSVDWSNLAAASIFTTAPVVLVFLLAQRHIIEGISAAGGGAITI